VIKEKIYELWPASDSSDADEHVLKRLREIFIDIDAGCFSSKRMLNVGIDLHTLDIIPWQTAASCPCAPGTSFTSKAKGIRYQQDGHIWGGLDVIG
jgi:hypothetical protein